MGTFRLKSDLRNHRTIVRPRSYDGAMVTQVTLSLFDLRCLKSLASGFSEVGCSPEVESTRNVGTRRCCGLRDSNSQRLHNADHPPDSDRFKLQVLRLRSDFVLASRMCRFEDGKPLAAPSRLTHMLVAACRQIKLGARHSPQLRVQGQEVAPDTGTRVLGTLEKEEKEKKEKRRKKRKLGNADQMNPTAKQRFCESSSPLR